MARSPGQLKNVAESRLVKLKALSKQDGIPLHNIVDRYAFTAFLRRLAASDYRDLLTLKGGMMMLVLTGESVRPTKDIDLHGGIRMTKEEVKEVMRKIAATPLEEDDGVVFDLKDLKVDLDRTDEQIGGNKISFKATIMKHRVQMNIDLGFENPIVPYRHPVSVPTIFEDEPSVDLMMYPVETSIAEKLRATIHHGMGASRMKDFFDIRQFAAIQEFDSALLAEALRRSCAAFKTEIPAYEGIDGFQIENMEQFGPRWAGFCRKSGINAGSFESCVADIGEFMKPIVDHIHGGTDPGYWRPGEGWGPRPTAAIGFG
jgi:hypothetical protein